MQTRDYAHEAPDMILYQQNKKTSLGYVQNIHNWTADYNFGTASEMNFEIPKKVYDTRTNSWIDNPNYDNLKPDMLLYLNDSTEYYKFSGGLVKADSYYDVVTSGSRTGEGTLSFDVNTAIRGFKMQNETMLFDLGTGSGYNWVWGGYIEDSNGTFQDCSNDLNGVYYKGYHAYYLSACKSFIPVHKGDIIAARSYANNKLYYYYQIHYYKDADASTWIKSDDGYYVHGSIPWRTYIDFSSADDEASKTLDEGYVRICVYDQQSTYKNLKYTTHLPNNYYLQIFSRERLCTDFDVNKSDIQGSKIPWWVITNIEETSDNGSNVTLRVTAHSYDITLSKKNFSISKGTLPLYIPDKVGDLVESDKWLYDSGKQRNQKFTRGLLNQILDYLPQWKIGYIAKSVCTKYRTLDDIDNANIYTFLTNDIASTYQCYFIFDSEKMTINIVDGEIQYNGYNYHTTNDAIGYHSKAVLTWQNAIKNTNIHSTDDRCVTALRVHTADDQYGLGLINPTGDNILYNFDSIKNQLDYTVNGSKNGRTLKTAVESWVSNYNSLKSDYQTNGKKLIDANLKKIQLASKVKKALTNYLTVADSINTKLIDKYGFTGDIPSASGGTTLKVYNAILSDRPRTKEVISNLSPWYAACYYNDTYYVRICSAAETYWNTKKQYDTVVSTYNTAYNAMKKVAKQLTLNYKTAIQANKDGIATILSPAEILELQNYITEGDWTNEDVVFSGEYSADDIITTLKDVTAQAKSDHDNYLSRQCYEFEIESANILAIPEMKNNIANLTLGTALSLEVKDGDWQYPILLSIHINYDDVSDFSLTFNTNYSAKPLKKRFIDCFNTISQISVKNTIFNFTE